MSKRDIGDSFSWVEKALFVAFFVKLRDWVLYAFAVLTVLGIMIMGLMRKVIWGDCKYGRWRPLLAALCLFATVPGSALASDFTIQRGTSTIPTSGNTVTITAGVDYTAPAALSNAFIRLTNTRFASAGTDTGAVPLNDDDIGVTINNPSNLLTSITFQRYSSDAANDAVVYWEIIEYTGHSGGGNEFVVRDQAEVLNSAGNTQVTGNSVGSISDTNDVVVFITGQREATAGTFSEQWLHTAEMLGTQPRFTRYSSTGNARVSYALVEFTGTNWDVQRVQHTMGSTGPESDLIPNAVNTNRTFLHVQNQSSQQGLDDSGVIAWMNSSTQLMFDVQTYPGSGQICAVWLVENSETDVDVAMKVYHLSGTRGVLNHAVDIYTNSFAGVASLSSASVMGECAISTGGGTYYPRGWINMRLITTNGVENYHGEGGQTQNYRMDVVQWPDTPNQSPDPPTLHDVPFDNEETPDTTPTFEFTAFDPDGTAGIVYQIEWDTDPSFGSPTTRTSSSNAGFTNIITPADTSPFTTSNKMQFTIQPGDALADSADDEAYFWRVRALDDSGEGGSGFYGNWSSVQSLRVNTALSKAQWVQTADGQFASDTLTDAVTNAGAVEILLQTLGTYSAAGTNAVVIPAGVTHIIVKAWGAGGGGGAGGTAGVGGAGGGGGYAQAVIAVTPGETLLASVGGGGGAGSYPGAYSGGGGGGAGRSSVSRQGTNLLIAAGGAGGGGGDNSSTTPGGAGGSGGGTTGVAGGSSGGAGGASGGTQVAGGAGGSTGGNSGSDGALTIGGAGADGRNAEGADGSLNNGGSINGGDGGQGNINNGYAGGGGGGAGYYGGGGGGGSQAGSAGGGGGGGGSSYSDGSGVTLASGSGRSAGNTNDTDYAGNAGLGGSGGATTTDGTAGSNGRIVIQYAVASVVSSSIDREWAPKEANWDQLLFTDEEARGGILYDVQYWTGSGWSNTVLTNLDTSPVDLSTNLVVGTHDIIRLQATFTPGGAVKLNDWTLTWDDGPEMRVSGKGIEIPDGATVPQASDDTDFGGHVANSGSQINTFQIDNDAYVKLLLTDSPPVAIVGSSDFTVQTQPAFTNLFGGGNMTFQVKYEPSVAGLATATVYIANNDLDEDPYTFAVQGTGVIPPTLINLAPTFVTINSARMNGDLISSGFENSDTYIYWGLTDEGTNAGAWDAAAHLGPLGDGAFYTNVTGLAVGTEYFYRCYAANSAGGDWATFTTNFTTGTDTTMPVVVNISSSDVTSNSATLRGDLLSNGGEDSEVYIYWGTTDGGTNFGSWDTPTYIGTLGVQQFATNEAGLIPGQQYFYRAFASNSVGGGWAPSTTNFTALWLPAIQTLSPNSVFEETANLNGNLTSTGGSPTQVTIYYGLTDGGTNSGSWLHSVSMGTLPTGSFTTNVTDLVDGALYYYRCYAENSDGGIWADETKNFSTLSLAGATIVQTFYIPFPEDDSYSAWQNIAPSSTIDTNWKSIVSIVVSISNTVVYYDQWEDGYEYGALDTNQTTTLVWGDGDLSNGVAPGSTNDILTAGFVISLDNDISTPRDSNDIYYDGRDRITATKPVGVTRAVYPLVQGGFMAGAVQVMDTTQYGISYKSPVGEDISYGNGIFEYVGMMIMAADDPTMIDIDTNGDGTVDIQTWLRKGENYFVDGGIQSGATVKAAKPVQVHLVTGYNSTYESRLYTLFPEYQWTDDYVSVVGDNDSGNDPVNIWLHNPDTNSAITVFYTNQLANGSVNVPAGTTVRYQVPGSTAGRYYTTNGAPFISVSSIGDDSARDWGYALTPKETMTTMIICPWGWGSMNKSSNDSPFFVTALTNTTLYVDFDGDPATGVTNDALGNRCDQIISVSPLDQIRIKDTVYNDNDQTGTRVYTLDGVLIAGAWGEDPDPATLPGAYPAPNNDDRALDMGATLMPFPVVYAWKQSELYTDNNDNGQVDPGDQVLYTITAVNYGFTDAQDVYVYDEVPAHTFYVAGTTKSNGVSVADEVIGNPPDTIFPVDETGYNLGKIKRKREVTLSYVLEIDDPFPDDVNVVVNSMYMNSSMGQRSDIDPIRIRKPGLRIVKSVTPTDAVEPGDTLTYSIFVENTGTVEQANIQIYDAVPDFTSYVTNTAYYTMASNVQHYTVADDFGTVAYTNNDGTTNWLSNWEEIGEANGPATDYVVISNSLGIGNSGLGLSRTVDGSGAVNATLSFFYRRFLVDQDSEYLDVDISSDGGTNWTTLMTIDAGENDPSNGVAAELDVSSYVSSNMALRFLAGGSGWTLGSDWIYIDNVKIDFADSGSGTVTNSVDSPPLLADGLFLFSGESVHLGLDVVVDDPADVSTLSNAAYVVSDKQLEPLYSRVTNMVVSATIGNFAWLDEDGDGTQDPGELPMTNLTVRLYNVATQLLETTTTDENGSYSFTGRRSGDYIVEVVQPTNYMYTTSDQGDADYDSDVGTNGFTSLLHLAKGETDNSVDAGFYQLATLGDRVWRDDNKNGVQNVGETNGFAGVIVTLYDEATNVVETNVTDASGNYLFTNVVPGNYFIGFTTPPEYTYTLKDQGSDNAKDSDASTNGFTDVFLLLSGTNNLTVDAGYYAAPSSIGDYVWIDANNDGVQNVGETNGIAGVTVTLYDDHTNLLDTTTTDASGNYNFANLLPGDYFLHFSTPTGFSFSTQHVGADDTVDSDPNTGTGNTDVFSLGGGTNDTRWDAGFYAPPSSIGDYIWVDTDKDGVQSGGETGLVGVTVNLYDGDDQLIGSTVSDASGMYSFTNLSPDTYYLEVISPSNYTLTVPDQGVSTNNSDFSKTTSLTPEFYLPPGTNATIYDAGFIAPTKGLSIDKISNTTGPVAGGDVITYTVTVANTGTVVQTGIIVSDILPDGLTYVPDSVTVVHPDDNTGTVADQFDSVAYNNQDGSTEWSNDWQEVSESDGESSGVITVTNVVGETNALNILSTSGATDGYAAWRMVNLDGEQRATLTYNYRRNLFGSDEFMKVEASSNAGLDWVEIASHEGDGGADSDFSLSNLVDITRFISTNTAIRFYADGLDQDEGFAVDNVKIEYGTAPGPGAPGDPEPVASGYNLATGAVMTVRLQATVDTAPASTTLVNRASVVSDTQPLIEASVTDTVEAVDLGVTKIVSDSFPGTNEVIYFTITVTNNGPIDATSVVLKDNWPADINYNSYAASAGSYDSSNKLWSGFDLAVGEYQTLIITGQVNFAEEGMKATNTIDIVGLDQYDTNPTNNISGDIIATAVILGRFEAFEKSGYVRVEWDTASEWRTVGFHVLRKDPGGEFERITSRMLPVLVPSRDGGEYAYVDDTADPSKNYIYRLLEVEDNGKRNEYGTTLYRGRSAVHRKGNVSPLTQFSRKARISEKRNARIEKRKRWLIEKRSESGSKSAVEGRRPIAGVGANLADGRGASRQKQLGLRMIGRTLYRAWQPPAEETLNAADVPVVEVKIGDGGVIASWKLKKSSGDVEVDASIVEMMDAVKKIPGLRDEFIAGNPTVTISFKVR